jgi:hypothetical protein
MVKSRTGRHGLTRAQEHPIMKTRLPQIVVLAAACCSILGPSQLLAQGRAGEAAKVTVGTVERTERVRLDSEAGSGVLVGGTLGLLSASGKSSGKKARNAIIGATGGAMIAGAAQGSREGMAYTVATGPGTRIKVISDQTGIMVGDCVAVEEAGATNNVRRIAREACDRASQQAVVQLQPAFQRDAAECVAAKDQLVNAATPQAVDIATRKVKILCNQ